MKKVPEILKTGIKTVKNVDHVNYGIGAVKELRLILSQRRSIGNGDSRNVVFLVDNFFQYSPLLDDKIGIEKDDFIYYVDTTYEPKTDSIDKLLDKIKNEGHIKPAAVVGIGGGTTMDTAKAISNLLRNPGKAEDYQGWDLLKHPGVFKIGIPTISGTGAEATRTCVMTNQATGLKLGMNSDFTVFNHILLDPELTATVPRNQYFYTGMDAYIHCIESIEGIYRNAVGDAYSRETIRLCQDVFFTDDMMSIENREKLMVASYLGGCAIATSYVGIIHPLSAALSVVYDIHHCVANCIVMRAMEEFYPKYYADFWEMVKKQSVSVPEGVCADASDETFQNLINATIIHQKPLTNALGENFRAVLTDEKLKELFKMM